MKVLNIKKETKGEILVEHCIDGFDFSKVRMVMEFLDWRWAFINAVPQISEMKDWVRELSQSLLKKMKENPKERKISSASGGFEIIVTRSYEGCEPDNVEIKFVLESWDQQALEETFE
jgi:hypothetical protein